MNNLPPGPSAADSIRYQQSLQQLDRVLETIKMMIGDSDNCSDSNLDDAAQVSNFDEDQEEIRMQNVFTKL